MVSAEAADNRLVSTKGVYKGCKAAPDRIADF